MRALAAILTALALIGCSTAGPRDIPDVALCRAPDTAAAEIPAAGVEREIQRLRLEWRACYRDARAWETAYRKAIKTWSGR